MEIVLAKTAGFCFGVGEAIKEINRLVDGKKGIIFTLGPIIHNEQVVKELEEKGVIVANNLESIDHQGTVVIRAHGVVPEIYKELDKRNFIVKDCTCLFVKKIHKLVKEKNEEGYQIIIVGDRNHPEVIGINGWCGNNAIIVEDPGDTENIEPTDRKACVVAQTTITEEKWENINKALDKKYKNIERFNTICNATSDRQNEAAEIAKKADIMFIIGGKNSSNTQKLFEISSKYCAETYKIETSGDLPSVNIKNKIIGVTAGASTPEWIIKEVVKRMTELNKENEMSFKDAFESSLVTLRTGEIVKGKIIGFNNAEVFVDMGYKSDGIISMEEFTDDPDFNPEESLKVGDEIDVFVVRVNDGEGNVQLSKKKVDSMKVWDTIDESYENKVPVKVKIVEVTKGGVIGSANGVRVFIPASQIGERFVKDLNEYLKQVIYVRIIELNKSKRKIVGSQRVLLQEERSKKMNDIWENIEVGKKYEGIVKSFTDFGAFVDIGGVDGLIHMSELSWKKIKHPSEVLKLGDSVAVTILDFDKEKKRISLGYRKLEDNPWTNAAEKYKAGDIINGKVVRLFPFGAFVELEEGIDGLVHISQISNSRIGKPGDVLHVGQAVEAKITEINTETKKISLSIKEVNPIEPANKNAAPEVENAEELPTEHKEELENTIGNLTDNLPKEE